MLTVSMERRKENVKMLMETAQARFNKWYHNMENNRFEGCKRDSNILSWEKVLTLIGSEVRGCLNQNGTDSVQECEEKSKDKCLIGSWQCDHKLEKDIFFFL